MLINLEHKYGFILKINNNISTILIHSFEQKFNIMWWIYALLSALFAALTAIFAKIGIKGVDTDLATGIRTVIILLLAWVLVFFKGSQNTINTLTKTNWIFLVLSGCATGFSWICYFKALQLGRVNQVAPVDKLSVAIAIVLAAVFLGEPITINTALAAMLIIAGTFVMIFHPIGS
jgi:transporter family protein